LGQIVGAPISVLITRLRFPAATVEVNIDFIKAVYRLNLSLGIQIKRKSHYFVGFLQFFRRKV